MPKNRIIYQTEALYAGPSPATGAQFSASNTYTVNQLHRVQSCNYGYTIPLRDVNQFGELAAIDRIIVESPTVNLDFTYLNNSFINEHFLGFFVNSGAAANERSCISGLLDKTTDERNYFVKAASEGADAIGDKTTGTTVSFISVGNGFISNFTAEGSVGDFPRSTITVEGLNVAFEASLGGPSGFITPSWAGNVTGCVINNPAVNPADGTRIVGKVAVPIATTNPFGLAAGNLTVSVLRPGDIRFDFFEAGTTNTLQEAGPTISDAKIQSYSLSFSLTREPLQKLGSKYAFAREITFPVTINLRIDANVGDLTTGNLVDVINADNTYDCRVRLLHPTSQAQQMVYTLKNARLESQNYTSSIGPNKAVTLNFTSQIGGPSQTDKGLFFSGVGV